MRIGLKLKDLIVLSIPLSFQTVQICLLAKIFGTVKNLGPALTDHTCKNVYMIAIGLGISSLLFLLAHLVSSRSVIRRLSDIRARIRSGRSAVAFSARSSDWDEIDELDLEVRRLLLDWHDHSHMSHHQRESTDNSFDQIRAQTT